MFSQYTSIPSAFVTTARKFSQKTALRVRRNNEYVDISWQSFYDVVCFLTLGLQTVGLKKNTRVCIISDNRAEWLYFDIAVLSNHATLVPMYTNCSDHDFCYILSHSEAEYLIVSNHETLARYHRLKEKNDFLVQKIIVIDQVTDMVGEHIYSYQYLVDIGRKQAQRSRNSFYELVETCPSDHVATVIYTSGTTGDPKGVMLTHKNFIFNCQGCSQHIDVQLDDVSLSFLPLSHIFERLAGFYFFLFSGATIGFAENLFTVMRDFKDIKPTIMCAVPRFFERIYHSIIDQIDKTNAIRKILFYLSLSAGRAFHTLRKRGRRIPFYTRSMYAFAEKHIFTTLRLYVGGNIRFFVSGGAALSKPIAQFFEIIGLSILEGYGLTEHAPVIAVNRFVDNRIGTVGRALPGVTVKIAEDGEILVKSESVMKGYYKDQDATDLVIKDGWLYTGDLGRIDQDGYIKILGRKKEIIVLSGGKNISPQRIENLLIADKFINQIVVFGDDRKHLVALVVPDKEQITVYAEHNKIRCDSYEELLEKKETIKFLKRRIQSASKELAVYERIKNFAILAKEFSLDAGELTPTYKVRRSIIYKKHKEVIDALYK